MEGFALLIGHLAGDYLFQDDWQAGNKTNPHPGPAPVETPMTGSVAIDTDNMFADIKAHDEWCARWNTWQVGNIACAVHCSLYTFAVWLCSFWWMPWWGLLACWMLHYPIDRFRLARLWMENVSGQKAFATGVFSPWSIIIVDNTFHLIVLLAIAFGAGRLPIS